MFQCFDVMFIQTLAGHEVLSSRCQVKSVAEEESLIQLQHQFEQGSNLYN